MAIFQKLSQKAAKAYSLFELLFFFYFLPIFLDGHFLIFELTSFKVQISGNEQRVKNIFYVYSNLYHRRKPQCP